MSRLPKVVPAGPRLAAKAEAERAARRHTRRRRTTIALACVAPLALVGWLLLASPVLSVHTVVVEGVPVKGVAVNGEGRLTSAQVLAALAVDDGTPLARVDTSAAAARVEVLMPVASATVTRRWPDTLTVTVIARTPVVAVAHAGRYVLLDAGGAEVASVPAAPKGVLRLLVAQPAKDDPATKAALTVLRGLPPTLRGQLGSLGAGSAEQVELTFRDGRKVLWGGVEQSPAKAAAVMALIKMPGRIYDVSAPGVVTRR